MHKDHLIFRGDGEVLAPDSINARDTHALSEICCAWAARGDILRGKSVNS